MPINLLKQSPITIQVFLPWLHIDFQLYMPRELDKYIEYLVLILEKSRDEALDCRITSKLGTSPKFFFSSRQCTFHAQLLQQFLSILMAMAQYFNELSNKFNLYMEAAEFEYRMVLVLESLYLWQQASPYSQQFRALMKSLFLKYSFPIDFISFTSDLCLAIFFNSVFSISTLIIFNQSLMNSLSRQGSLMKSTVMGPSPFFQLSKQGAWNSDVCTITQQISSIVTTGNSEIVSMKVQCLFHSTLSTVSSTAVFLLSPGDSADAYFRTRDLLLPRYTSMYSLFVILLIYYSEFWTSSSNFSIAYMKASVRQDDM